MLRYFLLRDNQETGPFTLTELKGKTLYTTDLIWVEDESTCWKLPSDIDSLKGLKLSVKKSLPSVRKQRPASYSEPVASADNSASLSSAYSTQSSHYISDETYKPPSFEALKEKYAQKPPQKKVWKRQVNIGANVMGLVTLFIGLGLSAYMVKKAVDNMDFEPATASAEATAIGGETLSQSTTAHAAFAGMVAEPEKQRLVPDTATVSQQVTQPVALSEAKVSLQSQEQKLSAQTAKQPVEFSASEATTQGKASADEASDLKEAALPANTKPTEKENISEKKEDEKPAAKPALRLAANKYEVGFLGGISNLEISVSNPSAQEVSKAVVEVEFLRPNGKVVGTQTVTVSNIAPGSSKTVSVPDNSRGVSVRYKVLTTEH